MNWGKITASILIILFTIGVTLAITEDIVQDSYVYKDKEEFNTIEEAFEFEKLIANEAIKDNAKILSLDLEYTSPPTVKYKIEMPVKNRFAVYNGDRFKYGSQARTKIQTYATVIGLGFFFWILFGGVIVTILFYKIEPTCEPTAN